MGIDLVYSPVFEQDVRSGSNACFKLAGAIAGRLRDGEQVAVTTKGAIPVLVVVKAIATAQEYLAEESIQLKFVIGIVDLENPEIRDATSTYLHFAIVPHTA